MYRTGPGRRGELRSRRACRITATRRSRTRSTASSSAATCCLRSSANSFGTLTGCARSSTRDVREVVRATVETIRSQLAPSAELELQVSPEVGSVRGARTGFGRCSSTCSTTLSSTAATWSAFRVAAAYGVVQMFVTDSGPGIPFSEQERIFEKFYRVGPALTWPSRGTGLGLYISRELAQRMGGRLEVRSQPGAGATFLVELPRARP